MAKSTTAPAVGSMVYDSHNNTSKVYDGNSWQDIVSTGSTIELPANIDWAVGSNPSVHYTDTTTITFDDGSVVTGKELRICMGMMLKLAMKECPEEFI